MQVFLPYGCKARPQSALRKSFAALDDRRRRKQVVECAQLLQTFGVTAQYTHDDISPTPRGWINHPARRMFDGYVPFLMLCYNLCLASSAHNTNWQRLQPLDIVGKPAVPWWFGKTAFHSAHRAALTVKAPEHYNQFSWFATQPRQYRYLWPDNTRRVFVRGERKT